MKTTLRLAALAAATFPFLASAQSVPPVGLTIYGRLDLSLNHIRYAGTPAGAATSHTFLSGDSAHLGFRGAEDLGGGARAYFKLEHWLNPDTGTPFNPVQFWSREAYVGLGKPELGYLQMGSQYGPGMWVSLKADPFLRSNHGALFTLFQANPGNTRGFSGTLNNALQYATPNFAGFTGRALFTAPEGVSPARSTHLGVDYTQGRVFAGLSIDRSKLTGAAAGQPALARVGHTAATFGATYRFDSVKLHGYAMQSDVDGLPKIRGTMLGATVPLASGDIRASWSRRATAAQTNADASLFAIGYFHFLSKRTTVYGVASRLANKGTARFGTWPSSVDAGPTLPRAGENISGVQLGIRHSF